MTVTGFIYDSVTGKNILTAIMKIIAADGTVISSTPLTSGQYYFTSTQNDLPGIEIYFTAQNYNTVFYAATTLLQNTNFDIQLNPGPVVKNEMLPIAAGIGILLLAAKKKKAVGKLETKDVMPYLLIGGVLVAGGVVKSILEKFGLITPAAVTKPSNDPTSFWNPLFYTHYSNYTKAIDTDQATTLANKIYDAFTPIGYYIEDITAAIHSLQTQSEVSFLAKVFNDIYGKDLYQFLINGWWPGDHISNDEAIGLNNFISQLPTN